jgi:acetyl-CoA carboxylase carboxyltransferase component
MSAVATATRTRAPEAPERGAIPRERVELLCDPGSFMPLRSGVLSDSGGAAGDGVLAGAGALDGRPVYCYAQDPKMKGGSLGSSHADSIVRVMRLAGDAGAPVVGFVESGGARLQEGHAALSGYGRIFRASVELSDRVPQVSVVAGVSAGGGAYSPALTDFVVMTEDARMFLTGPQIVREAMGEDVGMAELGGPGVHAGNGVCQLVAANVPEAVGLTRELLSFLPARIGARVASMPSRPANGADPGAPVPSDPRKVYDVRDVVAAVADDGRLLELDERWARSMVTGFARIEGRAVGVIANQPRRLGGVIDAEAAEKGALFVNRCDRFGIPLVVLVDTPGFMPGTRQEDAGVIRYGAQLLRAFAAARVPKLTVVLRKAYGGAVITMNSRGLGADMVFAWPGAEIGIMAARQAVGIVERRAIAAAPEPDATRDSLAAAYAGEHLSATTAAASGFVDEVIAPGETRRRVAWALGALEGVR